MREEDCFGQGEDEGEQQSKKCRLSEEAVVPIANALLSSIAELLMWLHHFWEMQHTAYMQQAPPEGK